MNAASQPTEIPFLFSARHSALRDSLRDAPNGPSHDRPHPSQLPPPLQRRAQSMQPRLTATSGRERPTMPSVVLSSAVSAAVLEHAAARARPPREVAENAERRRRQGVRVEARGRSCDQGGGVPEVIVSNGAIVDGPQVVRKNMVINDSVSAPAHVPKSALRPPQRTHRWVSAWFFISAPVIFWDAAYCFMRPRSFHGGDLHWIWSPYAIYQNVDLIYGVEAYARGDGFTNAQSFMNIVETTFNLWYLYLAHRKRSPSAPLVGFAAAVMTLSKTVLYMLVNYYCDYCITGHNDLRTLILFFIIPNGFWIAFPAFIIVRLGIDIVASLNIAEAASTQLTNGKAQ